MDDEVVEWSKCGRGEEDGEGGTGGEELGGERRGWAAKRSEEPTATKGDGGEARKGGEVMVGGCAESSAGERGGLLVAARRESNAGDSTVEEVNGSERGSRSGGGSLRFDSAVACAGYEAGPSPGTDFGFSSPTNPALALRSSALVSFISTLGFLLLISILSLPF